MKNKYFGSTAIYEFSKKKIQSIDKVKLYEDMMFFGEVMLFSAIFSVMVVILEGFLLGAFI